MESDDKRLKNPLRIPLPGIGPLKKGHLEIKPEVPKIQWDPKRPLEMDLKELIRPPGFRFEYWR